MRDAEKSASGQWTTERLNNVTRSLLSLPQNTTARSEGMCIQGVSKRALQL
jgi:hypothetical protein